jgi:hypothetical protein
VCFLKIKTTRFLISKKHRKIIVEKSMAERQGFEPWWGNSPQLISSQRRLAAPASLHSLNDEANANTQIRQHPLRKIN